LFDLDAVKANDLAARVRAAYPSCAVTVAAPTAENHDLLINATPAGMKPDDDPPVPLDTLDARLFVVDVITRPEVTPLLRHAQACGCRTMGGRHMLDGQAAEIMRFFGYKT
jgi:shikimate dehydrogenase